MLIRNKLTLLFTILVLAIQFTFSAFVYSFYSVYRRQEFYGQLRAKAQVFGRVLIGRQDVAHLLSARVRASDLLTLTDEQISIYDRQFRPLFDNQNASYEHKERSLLPTLTKQPVVAFTIDKAEGVGVVFRQGTQPYYVFVTGYDGLGRSKRENLLLIILIGNLGGFALILLAGWYVSGRFLQPLADMAQTVREVSANHLHTRVNEGNRRDEIAQLAITFNGLLGELERAFESQRQFVAHASHELRTPLTNVLGTLDISLTYDTDPAQWRQSMRSAIDEIRKLIQLTNSLLNLAKASGSSTTMAPIRLDECLLDAIAQVQQKYAGRQINLSFGTLSDDYYIVTGNQLLLTTAFANILDNACKYSEASVRVVLEKLTDADRYTIQVTDQGRGITSDDLPHVFSPLVRGHNVAGVQGFGVGLAITKQLITLHHGSIQIESSPDVGTTVHIELPALPAA
ncbi:sensor histidine kinase [Spirosoma montaniterrae]|uniref:histidine kinase n=1 Tax=Spirosoma montaniterrae TaxID=1178516 RepID=A0A1P9X2P7_9BACT|nr:HAMP domain-containing sensor histidine kinase [Spirosoma montaniterrae]AQG81900.1 hypothetical protein AWR27_22945 [Spirosoma montaniterrae]